jgi:hypothetical protein
MDIFNAWVDAQRKGVVTAKPSDVVANADFGTSLLCIVLLLLKLTSLPSIVAVAMALADPSYVKFLPLFLQSMVSKTVSTRAFAT